MLIFRVIMFVELLESSRQIGTQLRGVVPL